MKAAGKIRVATRFSRMLRLAWLSATAGLLFGSGPASASPSEPPAQPPAVKSIPDRVKAVRERIAVEAKTPSTSRSLYRLTQFFNFPNFPNFPNFNNFPNFPNFPNFR